MRSIRNDLIPADEVRARFGGVSESTLYRWSKTGEIPRPIKVGRVRLWDRSELDQHVDTLKGNRAGGHR